MHIHMMSTCFGGSEHHLPVEPSVSSANVSHFQPMLCNPHEHFATPVERASLQLFTQNLCHDTLNLIVINISDIVKYLATSFMILVEVLDYSLTFYNHISL